MLGGVRSHPELPARENVPDNDACQIPPYCEPAYHMTYLLLPSLSARQQLIDHLKSRGILSVFHYLPLHLSDMGRKFGGFQGQCPVTESVSDRLLRLPFYNDLTESEQNEVIETVCSFQFNVGAGT